LLSFHARGFVLVGKK